MSRDDDADRAGPARDQAARGEVRRVVQLRARPRGRAPPSSGATRGSPRSARETVDWLILSLRAMSLLVTATIRSIGRSPPRARAASAFDKITASRTAIYAYVVTPERDLCRRSRRRRARTERATTTMPSRRSSTRSSPPSRRTGTPPSARYSARLDGWEPESLPARPTTRSRRASSGSRPRCSRTSRFCQEQVRTFAEAQRATMTDLEVETLPGVRLGHRHIPVASVGAYVPGGRYPMVASAHMSVVTAKVAGVERVAACTPPLDGRVPAATVAAMQLAGADEIYVLGGVQALAALALGTETIDPVDFLVGPGQRVRRRGEAPAVRRGRHRPVRRPDRDPDRRRRDRRPRDRRRRPARPGRARPGLAGRARHDVGGAGRARRCARSPCSSRPADRRRSRRARGATTARSSSSTRDEEASPSPTRYAFEHVEILTARPALVPRAHAQLRRAVPRRGDHRRLRRQDDRHEPHPADARRGALHRRAVGRQVPQDRDLPGVRRRGERR